MYENLAVAEQIKGAALAPQQKHVRKPLGRMTIEEAAYHKKLDAERHDKHMQDTFSYLVKAAEIRGNGALMADLKIWVQAKRKELDEQFVSIGL